MLLDKVPAVGVLRKPHDRYSLPFGGFTFTIFEARPLHYITSHYITLHYMTLQSILLLVDTKPRGRGAKYGNSSDRSRTATPGNSNAPRFAGSG